MESVAGIFGADWALSLWLHDAALTPSHLDRLVRLMLLWQMVHAIPNAKNLKDVTAAARFVGSGMPVPT